MERNTQRHPLTKAEGRLRDETRQVLLTRLASATPKLPASPPHWPPLEPEDWHALTELLFERLVADTDALAQLADTLESRWRQEASSTMLNWDTEATLRNPLREKAVEAENHRASEAQPHHVNEVTEPGQSSP